MPDFIKSFLEWYKTSNIKGGVYDINLLDANFTKDQINEIKEYFIANMPDKIHKYGECPNCSSDIECYYNQFDNQSFSCGCGLKFKGKDSNTQGVIFTIK